MPGSRRLPRRAACIALLAILFSALPPAVAHAVAFPGGIDSQADFCSTVDAAGPVPAIPLPSRGNTKVCAHCDGCTGNSASPWAPPSAITLGVLLDARPRAIISADVPAATAVDVFAAPARGPPSVA